MAAPLAVLAKPPPLPVVGAEGDVEAEADGAPAAPVDGWRARPPRNSRARGGAKPLPAAAAAAASGSMRAAVAATGEPVDE